MRKRSPPIHDTEPCPTCKTLSSVAVLDEALTSQHSSTIHAAIQTCEKRQINALGGCTDESSSNDQNAAAFPADQVQKIDPENRSTRVSGRSYQGLKSSSARILLALSSRAEKWQGGEILH